MGKKERKEGRKKKKEKKELTTQEPQCQPLASVPENVWEEHLIEASTGFYILLHRRKKKKFSSLDKLDLP